MITTIHYLVVRSDTELAYTATSSGQTMHNTDGQLVHSYFWVAIDSTQAVRYVDQNEAIRVARAFSDNVGITCDVYEITTTVTRRKVDNDAETLEGLAE